MQIEENVLLSTLTTFKTGGPARFVITASTDQEVGHAYAFAKEKGLPVVPLGAGSNVLAPDGGLNAVVVRLAPSPIMVEETETEVRVTAGAGVVWDALVAHAVQSGWWGVENLSAIPGTVGGAVVQNIGAYGAVLGDTCMSVDAYDSVSGEVKTFSNTECQFGYRTSIFKQQPDRYCIVRATLALTRRPTPNVGYKDLATRFAAAVPTLAEVRAAVTEIRAQKFPSLGQFGTAGSFFLNPVMSSVDAARVQALYPTMPVFVLPEGGIKVPLGWLFEHVLQLRGHRDGNVEAWREQALVVATHPGATSAEVVAFAQKISERVAEVLKIKIAPEVRILQSS